MLLLFHIVADLTRLLGPGGVRGLVAENLLIKQQLLILTRVRQRADVYRYRWKPHRGELYPLPVAAWLRVRRPRTWLPR